MTDLSRRQFLATVAASAFASRGRSQPGLRQPDTIRVPARAVTKGPKHHFFGYYDKTPWDQTGRYLLAMEVDFCDRQPQPGETLTVGLVDLQDGDRYHPLDTTAAWSWQQGTMLQWLGSAPDREVVYNSIADGRPIAVIRDVQSGKTRTLPRPIYALSTDGKQAVTLDYARLHRLRPGYGYVTLSEKHAADPAPKELGIWHMNMANGENRLVVSLAQLAANKADARFASAEHWVNHLQFNPSGTRFIFLHRWKRLTDSRWFTRLYTAKPDGSDLRLHLDYDIVSHFDWRDDETFLAWARIADGRTRFVTVDVNTNDVDVVGEGVLTQDGHCSYSPDRQWILNDTYPDKNRMQWLMLFKPATGRRYDLNQFYSPKQFTGPIRCDLHPRWNRDGTQVCIDGCHDPQRQVYVLDVSEIVQG
jgi:hypothetical protein